MLVNVSRDQSSDQMRSASQLAALSVPLFTLSQLSFQSDHFSELLPLDSAAIRAIPSFLVFFDGLSAALIFPALF
jgi:hypothetical protein